MSKKPNLRVLNVPIHSLDAIKALKKSSEFVHNLADSSDGSFGCANDLPAKLVTFGSTSHHTLGGSRALRKIKDASTDSEDHYDYESSDDQSSGSDSGTEVNAHKVYDPRYETSPDKDLVSKFGNTLKCLSENTSLTSQVPSFMLPMPLDKDDAVTVPNDILGVITAPTAVLSHGWKERSFKALCREYIEVSDKLSGAERSLVAVILLRSGRFATGVFSKSNCLYHTTSTRYTVRKGQGGTQASNDSSKGKAKSIGSQLRRQGEKALKDDVYKVFNHLADQFRDSIGLVFISCPKVMQRSLYEECAKGVLEKNDERIRYVPLSVKRPSYEEVCRVYETLTNVTIRRMSDDEHQAFQRAISIGPTDELTQAEEGLPLETKSQIVLNSTHAQLTNNDTEVPYTSLHLAAMKADIELVDSLLAQLENDEHLPTIDVRCGPQHMTALHVASAYSGDNVTDAASVVRELLVRARANPCVVDSHGRPPYFLATSDRIRDVFRLARGELGESYCDWKDGAKVGPALTKDSLQRKKERAAEKKRNQRARQKEKKALERKAAEEHERSALTNFEDQTKAEDAMRIRDGLGPMAEKIENACDFCQRIVKKKSQLLSRLTYKYCCMECVRSHQRELMAVAAISRLGG